MVILPAIDIKDGKPVRLFKGDFSTASVVAEGVLSAAKGFESAGAEWLHMVDLDGAKNSAPANAEIILKTAAETGLKIEVGGGIRDLATAEYYLNNGIERVIFGSAALSHPEIVESAVQKYGERICVGIDAKNGMVAVDGWLKVSGRDFISVAKSMEKIGVKYIVFTDISRDGTLTGPNLDSLEQINNAVGCNIIASGGVTDINDIKNLAAMGLYGAICGKSLYSGSLDLGCALKEAKTVV